LDSLQQLAADWANQDLGATITVEHSFKDAVLAVQSKYNYCGAQILVVGSVYQAGAAMKLLDAEERHVCNHSEE
jgi:folylpolyglutamate synthase/dihydropteroate synthase